MHCDRIIKFGDRFKGRINSSLLQGALNYISYNEEGLAFEILCDHICEYDILITDEEYVEAIKLASEMGLNLEKGPFKHLAGLRK
ncbi:MafI family immunity protein [Achromobacter denitrificans]|uniref:MafI family immunity protein n=1 Tax=Achromobacter denitrificans TaxID=32002 RepID=UPI000F4EE446|nr:MafI family immunity protein [Achromobacter sp.]QCS65103.1 MafI family immunity protein [Achromobacter denitrificans]RSE74243.1 MafI family immunity protein [Achromobacter denitrificans]